MNQSIPESPSPTSPFDAYAHIIEFTLTISPRKYCSHPQGAMGLNAMYRNFKSNSFNGWFSYVRPMPMAYTCSVLSISSQFSGSGTGWIVSLNGIGSGNLMRARRKWSNFGEESCKIIKYGLSVTHVFITMSNTHRYRFLWGFLHKHYKCIAPMHWPEPFYRMCDLDEGLRAH